MKEKRSWRPEYLNVLATVACFVASLGILVTVMVTIWTSINGKIDSFHAEMRDIHGK